MKKADLILLNGKIITVNNEFAICEAVAISGNKIIQTGSSEEIRKLSGESTRIIDLQGGTVVPGLIDSHLHPEPASLSELEDKIPDVHTISELLGWISGEAKRKGHGKWIIFPKFFPTRLVEMRQPTLEELDRVAPHNPVFLNGSFGGMINSEAMKISGISGKTNDPGVLKNPETGLPTGFIRATGFDLLKMPSPRTLSPTEKEDALKSMITRYNEYGFTSLLTGTGDPGTLRMYRDMAARKVLTARISQNMLLPVIKPVTRQSVTEALSKYDQVSGEGDEWVRTGSLKVFLDGGILTGTAYMEEPWGTKAAAIFGISDTTYRGVVNLTRDELETIVSVANEHGWSFTAHATGEAAVDLLLDVYESVDQEKPVKGKRFSVIHGNFFNPEAIRKMSGLGIYANIQPAWFYKDTEAMDSILGHEKVKIFHPYRTLSDAGILINGGSDHMVKWDATTSINPYNPFLAMYTMVTRKTERGNIIHPEEALTREEALKAYTINNSYATFEEAIKGSIEPGKLADLVLLDRDFLTCPADSIKNIKVLMTILDGKVIYSNTNVPK